MTDLAKRRAELIAWAQSCLDSGDFHGLRDCAADLEVVEARMEERGLKRVPAMLDLGQRIETPGGAYFERCNCKDCNKARGDAVGLMAAMGRAWGNHR